MPQHCTPDDHAFMHQNNISACSVSAPTERSLPSTCFANLHTHQSQSHARVSAQTQNSNFGHPPFPLTSMSLVAEAAACLDSIEDIEALTPRQWPQCHRTDASPSRSLQEGFAQLLDKWMRHPEHRIRLKCINRMGHLCNFLLDILCILGVHGMTLSIARLHSLSTFFVDYLRIDPQLDMDRMLQNRTGISAGYRMAGKYLAIIQPFSALLSNVKFRSRQSMHANMQPSLELLREWEACLMMEDIALTIRSSIALLESINSYVHMLPVPRSARFLQRSDRHHELAELADEWTQRTPSPSQPEPSSASASPPGLPQPISQRNAPYCIRFQADNFHAKACKATHVCSVPDCTGNQD